MDPFYQRMPDPPGSYGSDDAAGNGQPFEAPPEEQVPTETPPLQTAAPLTPAAPVSVAAPGPSAASRRAGAAVVVVGVGAGTGALLGGLWGAGSGLFIAGAAMNALRTRALFASPLEADRKEGIKTAVMAVLGLGVGGYLGYRAQQRDDDD